MSKDCDIEKTKSKPKFYAERLKPPKKVKLKDAYNKSVEKHRAEGFAEGVVKLYNEGLISKSILLKHAQLQGVLNLVLKKLEIGEKL